MADTNNTPALDSEELARLNGSTYDLSAAATWPTRAAARQALSFTWRKRLTKVGKVWAVAMAFGFALPESVTR